MMKIFFPLVATLLVSTVNADSSFALLDSIAAAAACAKTTHVSHFASTIETLATPRPLAASLHSASVPATRTKAAEDLSMELESALQTIRSDMQEIQWCADMPAVIDELSAVSRRFVADFSDLAPTKGKSMMGVAASLNRATHASSAIAETFNDLVLRWVELPWCPKAAKGIMESMQVASQDWIQLYSTYSEGNSVLSLDAAMVSSATWAQAFTNVTDAWQQVTATPPPCRSLPAVMATLKQMVTSIAGSTQAWVAYFDKLQGEDEDEVEVMAEWLRPMQSAMSHVKENSMTWTHTCTAEEVKDASAAVADFIEHFSSIALTTSKQWASAFASCAPECFGAAEQGSILAASMIRASDIAQISHMWSMAFAKSTAQSIAEASQVWADAFAQIVDDAVEESNAWISASSTHVGDDVTATSSASDSWASAFQLLSVSLTVAADGWTTDAAELLSSTGAKCTASASVAGACKAAAPQAGSVEWTQIIARLNATQLESSVQELNISSFFDEHALMI